MRFIFAALSVLGLLLSFSGTPRAEDLDGTKWKLDKHGVHKMIFWKTYLVSFSAGQVSKGKGRPTAYTSAEDGSKTTWRSEKIGGKGEKIVMTGTADGDKMVGAVMKTGKDGKTKTYTWTASRISRKR